MLEIYDDKSDSELLIWACECRNSDRIMVILADNTCSNINDLFNEIAYSSARYFNAEDYFSAVNYAYRVIKKNFGQHFKEEYTSKFKMHKTLADLQKIAKETSELDYEDYYDLATFENLDNLYFCDLIINDGKLGLRFSKYTDEECDEFDNLIFKEWNPNLTSSTTLMLGMQKQLDDFIEEEMDYELNVGI